MVSPASIDQLRRSLSPGAELWTPSSAGYDEARAVFNHRFDKRPAVIVACATNQDVAATVKFSCDQALQLSVRSGGTSPAGFSSNDGGVLLDVSRFNAMDIDRTALRVRMGAGVLLGTAYSTLAPTGMMIVAGECKPVGVSGLMLGGGFSLLSRSLGLACDNVLGATIVLANGDIVSTNATDEADLFWALRGAGGGNFGVVTSLDVKLHQLPPAVYCQIAVWPLDQAASVITQAMAYFHDEAPDELNAVWSFAAEPDGTRVLGMVGVYNGPAADGEKAMARLTALGKPAMTKGGPQSYGALVQAAFPSPAEAVHDYFKSGFVKGALPAAAAQLLADRFAATPEDGSALENLILFELAGGAINRVAPDATAFVHRQRSLLLSVCATWQGPTGVNDTAETRWADALHADLTPYFAGDVYQNYPDASLTDWAEAYYGANLPRLKQVKRRYDPGNVFRFAQSIPPG